MSRNLNRTGKPVIYHVFTRLFGNKNSNNVAWGTREQNGVGKFSDFDDRALAAIANYGTTHIWYTGVPHHALLEDYQAYGISDDHPQVVKGRAGSPYAVKDYYNVNPDLANDPENRLNEFKDLIARTHKHGMQVIIDIVPNHVARHYQSMDAPIGTVDFGAADDTSHGYSRNNDFYYLDQDFEAPDYPSGFEPLQDHPLSATDFVESPAKWTGNGSRLAKPDGHDWYETIKVNYGVKPDGSHDFESLPKHYRELGVEQHYAFWSDKPLPSAWAKFKDIALFWMDLGVDGFRFDMAEMVPVEFWSYLNSQIKTKNADALVLAEVYQPELYRDYVQLGLMDCLYDKVDLYDTLKAIITQNAKPSLISRDQALYTDIDKNLLRFMENHDEQRIASPEFAGDPWRAWPAMVVTTLLGQGPTLLYFGQAQGERADQDLGYGKASRTTIFDYAGVPAHQAWMNDGLFDGGSLSASQWQLDAAYQRLLRYSTEQDCLSGEFVDLHTYNLQHNQNYDSRCYAFIRQQHGQWCVVVVNFDDQAKAMTLLIPQSISAVLDNCSEGLVLREQINTDWTYVELQKVQQDLSLSLDLPAYGAVVYQPKQTSR
ncbi:alpha-amylase [Alginatibacterium sediminis]|uniref:Alpha-amylase n=1 Tax=Alginatibacterium sediminis TaxID=2164068 RepID=A0A420E8D5_9ALTE|nr:alpha-amylase family glycosyl hydrolase [Alginatibacterium sediminis]RKF15650.1 alpha-amylase [Alginatibacterium sediminis]